MTPSTNGATLWRLTATAVFAFALAACQEDSVAPQVAPNANVDAPGVHLQYGTPVKVGAGRARTFVVLDAKNGNAPLEVGVALDERALDGLPAPNPEHADMGHEDMHTFLLPMPAQSPAPYTFIELNWNPAGHSPPYHVRPHFDFHFWTASREERSAIDPADALYATKAATFPPANEIPAGYVCPCDVLGVPPAAVTVPQMGLHWIDPTSPEYQPQPPGVPQDFTRTYIVGTWNGRVIFHEPMITREFLLGKPDETIPVPVAAAHTPDGYYPSAYRVRYDAKAKEYRVSLSGLAWRQ